ncbi:enoyl-CoA hydratase [Aliidongia dinghuensis]|uniref:Enoyl-CoA hydratase n=1 Tax=Aliidongia dinghuensis TaxID=1867774 RepID=A0A8J2YYM7_9PROT|nr:MaoC family dehydratase [Aliidongia dinghuensis]GGF34035.1 enoyl-CoA hydratase [Aliidongia dinghuensis]
MDMAKLGDRIGQELGVSPWLAVEQDRIDRFAEATDDHQWIHVDRARAAAGPFGTTVAHGFLTLSLLAPTAYQVLADAFAGATAFNYGLDKVRFVTPVRAGARVRNRITLLAIEEKSPGRWLVTTENQVEIEGEAKPALIAVSLVMILPG